MVREGSGIFQRRVRTFAFTEKGKATKDPSKDNR